MIVNITCLSLQMSQDQNIQQSEASSFGNHFDEKGMLSTVQIWTNIIILFGFLNVILHMRIDQHTVNNSCSPKLDLYSREKVILFYSLIVFVFLYALVVVIGDQELPKISTQALKEQHEKNIEEATPSKQIKVMKVHDHTMNQLLHQPTDKMYYKIL